MAKKSTTQKNASTQQVELLQNVVRVVAGDHAIGIVDLLHGKKNVNEFLISKKLNLNINQTRNILYKLSDVGLVSFIRKKDKKNGGWYTYFWTLDIAKSLVLFRDHMENSYKKIESELARRKNERFYYSPSADLEYTEEQALENNFICPETGEVMELEDNTERVAQLENKLEALKKNLETLDEEVGLIQKKDEGARQRKIKAEEKKKAEERAAKRKERAAAKKKLVKKVAKKKTVKKKVTKKKTSKTSKAGAKKTIKKRLKKSTNRKVKGSK